MLYEYAKYTNYNLEFWCFTASHAFFTYLYI